LIQQKNFINFKLIKKRVMADFILQLAQTRVRINFFGKAIFNKKTAEDFEFLLNFINGLTNFNLGQICL